MTLCIGGPLHGQSVACEQYYFRYASSTESIRVATQRYVNETPIREHIYRLQELWAGGQWVKVFVCE
jgi:hypothetical protein